MIRRAIAATAALVFLCGSAEPSFVDVSVAGLRSDRGTLRACMTRAPAHFPDCSGDPNAITSSVPAGAKFIRFASVPQGNWALSVLHDENGNGKLDKFLGVPKEGIAFSRNPTLLMGPPAFKSVSMAVGPDGVRAQVKVQYLL